jgi:hypothetical protein
MVKSASPFRHAAGIAEATTFSEADSHRMIQIDLLLPFILPPPAMAADLMREIKAPSLEMLLGRANADPLREFDDFAHALPHERWLGGRFSLPSVDTSSPPVACAAMARHGLSAEEGVWFLLQPAHFHIARDHLVLTDQRRLGLSDADGLALFDEAQKSFAAAGMTLLFGSTMEWFVRADAWADLHTAAPDAACGHNIDIWMPKGPGERDWRKIQNEVQMDWHASPVNAAREARGLKPVNSLWLWGAATPANRSVSHYTRSAGLGGWTEAFMPSGGDSIIGLIESAPLRGLGMIDSLTEAAMAGDWAEWLARVNALEVTCFSPLMTALQGGWLDKLTLVMTHNTRLSEYHLEPKSLAKFWRKVSLKRLAGA